KRNPLHERHNFHWNDSLQRKSLHLFLPLMDDLIWSFFLIVFYDFAPILSSMREQYFAVQSLPYLLFLFVVFHIVSNLVHSLQLFALETLNMFHDIYWIAGEQFHKQYLQFYRENNGHVTRSQWHQDNLLNSFLAKL